MWAAYDAMRRGLNASGRQIWYSITARMAYADRAAPAYVPPELQTSFAPSPRPTYVPAVVPKHRHPDRRKQKKPPKWAWLTRAAGSEPDI